MNQRTNKYLFNYVIAKVLSNNTNQRQYINARTTKQINFTKTHLIFRPQYKYNSNHNHHIAGSRQSENLSYQSNCPNNQSVDTTTIAVNVIYSTKCIVISMSSSKLVFLNVYDISRHNKFTKIELVFITLDILSFVVNQAG